MGKVGVVGSFVVDLMARTPRLPIPGETVKGSFFKMGPGGKGFNQAIAAARAGAQVLFSTKLGRDDFAHIATDLLEKEPNIDGTWVFDTERATTGIALISVEEATSQNEIVVVPGACDTYTDEDIASLEGLLSQVEHLLLQLELNQEAVEKIIRIAADKGIKVILNPAPAAHLSPALYPLLFAVTPNETEAAFLSGLPCDTDEDYRSVAAWFHGKGVENVIITIGKRGVFFSDGTEQRVIPNYDVKVVDTTGAGDAFSGGLLAALGNGASLRDACVFGNVVANLSVTKRGTSVAMPWEHEIKTFMNRH